MEDPRDANQLRVAARIELVERAELVDLVVLARERAHHAHAREVLLHARRETREETLNRLEAAVDRSPNHHTVSVTSGSGSNESIVRFGLIASINPNERRDHQADEIVHHAGAHQHAHRGEIVRRARHRSPVRCPG